MITKKEKTVFLVFVIFGAICAILRLTFMGWLALLGIISFFFFGIIHITLILTIVKNKSQLSNKLKRIGWTLLILFPLIFLFQFDFGDNAGNFFVYEVFIGDLKSTKYDEQIFLITFIAAFLYLLGCIVWFLEFRSHKKQIT